MFLVFSYPFTPDFHHLSSSKLSNSHSFTLPLFSGMSAILADSLHVFHRSPEEMGPKTRQLPT